MSDWMTILTIISAVSGIAGVAFAVFVGLRTRQIFRPQLVFNVGLAYADEDVQKAIRRDKISTLIFGAKIPPGSEVSFMCPYLMVNNSKLPISNVTLQLQYASKYVIKNDEEIIGIVDKGTEYELHVLRSPPDWLKRREVFILGSMAQVMYTIPVLRPGEAIVIADPIRFGKHNRYCEKENEDYGINKELAKRLRGVERLRDFCVIDIFIYSESCPPLSSRIKLLWFDADSEEELLPTLNNALKTFWGGKWPEPGLYLAPWPLVRKKPMVTEYGELIIPKLNQINLLKHRYFYWENPLQSERIIVGFGVPSWNYYQLPGDLNADELMSKFGYQKLISMKTMEKLNVLKRLKKWRVRNSTK